MNDPGPGMQSHRTDAHFEEEKKAVYHRVDAVQKSMASLHYLAPHPTPHPHWFAQLRIRKKKKIEEKTETTYKN